MHSAFQPTFNWGFTENAVRVREAVIETSIAPRWVSSFNQRLLNLSSWSTCRQSSRKMSATTFKNLIQRREHKERSQPAARQHMGILEKHGDYVRRATNYHDKEKRILALRRKAAFRNPDEFYHKMSKSETKVSAVLRVAVQRKCGCPCAEPTTLFSSAVNNLTVDVRLEAAGRGAQGSERPAHPDCRRAQVVEDTGSQLLANDGQR